MRRRMVCRSGHAWRHVDDPKKALQMPRCPVCDELPGIGSSLTMGITAWGCFLLVAWLLVPMALMAVAIILFRPGPGAEKPIIWTTTGICFAGLFLVGYLLRDRVEGSNWNRFLASLRLSQAPSAPEGWQRTLRRWPVVGSARGGRCWVVGRFEGTTVKVVNLQCGGGKRKYEVTAAFFEDPIAGLPDFDIHPTADSGKFWNVDMLVLLRLRRPPPLQGEAFGRFFRLEGVEPERLESWLTPEERDRLAQARGWAIQAREGRLAIWKPMRCCPTLEWPTFLAVAAHIRRLFLRGSQVKKDEAGATEAE